MRRKSKNLSKVFLYILLVIIFVIALIFVKLKNTNSSDNNKILRELNNTQFNDLIHELPCRLRHNKEYSTNTDLREQLNKLINEKFKECSNLCYYSFNPRAHCYIGNIYHYVNIKILLNKFDNYEINKVTTIVNSSYEKNRNIFIKDYLAVRDNRLWKTLTLMNWLNLLNESEKKFWVNQYSRMKLDESQPLFPQTYNRVRVLQSLGINTVRDLKNYDVTDINSVCIYKPVFQDAFNQNIFRENKKVMINKYVVIRNFCLQSLNSSEKEELKSYSNIDPCSVER